MLAALNLGAIVLGVAAGGLTASVVGFLLGVVLSLLGIEGGADIGLVIGIVAGLGAAGWVAGLKARHSERFHGAVTGLLIAFLVMVIARLGGSQAPTLTVLWLALVAVLISGMSGWLAGRRKRATS